MKRSLFVLCVVGATLLLTCCQKKSEEEKLEAANEGKSSHEQLLEGDKTIYGIACEGCTDSVIVLLPNDGSDPVRYDIIDAFSNHRVLGDPEVGDWIGVVRNEADTTIADLVLDLDELKGTWCYVVMPRMKAYENMSAKLQARMMRDMPDSLKEQYLIPREYGFTLKRQWAAQSVGYIHETPAMMAESPVTYPPLSYFTEWHIWNGKLVMTSGKFDMDEHSQDFIITGTVTDTCDIDYLQDDSLVLSSEGASRSYYRKNNTSDINKKAKAIAALRMKQEHQ